MRTSTVTLTPIAAPYQLYLRDIPTGCFCLYHDRLHMVGSEDTIIQVADGEFDGKELSVERGDFDWDDLCVPVDVEVSYSVVSE